MGVDQPAPGFTLPDVDGNVVRVEDYRDRKCILLVLRVSRAFT